MAARDIVVIGASTGGIQVLSQILAGLPAGLPAALFVTCHIPAVGDSKLPEILSRAGRLLATFAHDKQPIYPGQVYVAPPDHHLLLEEKQVRVTRGPRENFHRPAIDPMFRSAARTFGPRVIGVILSGYQYDGVAGLLAIRQAGGVAVVQDPADADAGALPQTAYELAGADYVVPATRLASVLREVIQRSEPENGGATMPEMDPLEKLPEKVTADMLAQENGHRRGATTVFTCPECGGTLWQADEKEIVRFRCHVGHSFLGLALLNEQASALEAALWTAVRTFKERVILSRQLAHQELSRGNTDMANRFEEQANLAERYSNVIQEYLLEVSHQQNKPTEVAGGVKP